MSRVHRYRVGCSGLRDISRPVYPRQRRISDLGLPEHRLRGARVRILSGQWAGQEGHLMRGDYGFNALCVKLDPQEPPGIGTYVEVQESYIEHVERGE